jgi:hypothetical protein
MNNSGTLKRILGAVSLSTYRALPAPVDDKGAIPYQKFNYVSSKPIDAYRVAQARHYHQTL